jgi:hypothetical protein
MHCSTVVPLDSVFALTGIAFGARERLAPLLQAPCTGGISADNNGRFFADLN